ncbi:FHA domain-containing protein [Rathayibacter sp. VKM Ac-2927]|uniref:FHA domain-containing protein n=1 Tax=Rathayibacter sp. VKM Ac-2927 TaxID=2929478 RepID=UPI001FB1D538|nr:FHA domain-containing protein [Rathayibacter sp. VKM Ac-2927]
MKDVVTKKLTTEYGLFLTHGTTPVGSLLLVIPQATAATIAEYASLFDIVVRGAADDAFALALVNANTIRYPGADRAHREKVQRAAAAAPKASVDIAYVTSYGTSVKAVFGSDRKSALRRAQRAFADEVPANAVVTDVPIEIAEAEPAVDLLAYFDTPRSDLGAASAAADGATAGAASAAASRGVPTYPAAAPMGAPTRSAADQETRWATPRRGPEPTQPATPITAVLSHGSTQRTTYLRSGVGVSYGRGNDNTVTVVDDPTMSAQHATLTAHGDRLAVHSTGRTGTWVTPMAGGAARFIGVGETVTVDLPVRIVLGDARDTVVAVSDGTLRT